MAITAFLNMLLSQEENQKNEISINNGFVFNNIENNRILKLLYNSKKYVLFSDIKINKNYFFWMIFPKERKSYILFYLNNSKRFLPRIKYPSEDYDEICKGFSKDLNTNKYIDNFEGVIETFMFLINS